MPYNSPVATGLDCKFVVEMGGSTWVQDKTELFEGELVVFKRPNSPNFYMRVWIAHERKHYQQSLKTKSHFEAVERAKSKYKELQIKVARAEKVFTSTLSFIILAKIRR